MRRLRILHAVHDFLPRHHAGSEIYVRDLARALASQHDVFVTAAEYDLSAPHGTIRWRTYDGLPVVEIVNNWEFERFEETYASPRMNRQLGHVLDATAPDVLHVHNLLNLSFDLPRLARERGIATLATLHDHTLVCASGGQRVHVEDEHVCHDIDPDRCRRCFERTPFHAQWTLGRLRRAPAMGRALALAGVMGRRFPAAAERVAGRLPGGALDAADVRMRLSYARHVFDQLDHIVAPSAALAGAYAGLGLDPARVEVSDYGFVRAPSALRSASAVPRFGFVGSLVWHKGIHVLLRALKLLRGSFHLAVFGDPGVSPAYSQELRQLAAGLPVEFRGAFGRDDVPRVYASIDVLIVPSLWPENSPLVIHEAFMHGTAVAGTRMGGIPELVADGLNGLLYDAFDDRQLAGVLQRFIDDPALARRLAAAAPPVKGIEDDARDWVERYHAALASAPAPAIPS